MNVKILSIFIILMLLFFGLGYSIRIIIDDDTKITVKINCNHKFGKAPLNVSFSSEIFSINEDIKSYSWDFNDGKSSTNPIVNHTFYREGTFNVSLRVIGISGKGAKDSIEITVFEEYKPIASAIANTTCGKAPLSIQFGAECFDVDGDVFVYKWDFDDRTVANIQNPQHTFEETGIYNVRLTIYDEDGLEDTDSIEINVIDNYSPVAYASADKFEGGAPLTVEFKGDFSDIDGDLVSYKWYFENTIISQNSASTEQNPIHTFYFPGTYIVRLTVEDESGASDTDIVIITVKESTFSNLVNHTINVMINKFINGTISELLGNIVRDFFSIQIAKILVDILEKITEKNLPV